MTHPSPPVADDGVVERMQAALRTELFERQGLGYDVPQGVNDGSIRIGGCVSLDGLARAALAASDRDVLVKRIGEIRDVLSAMILEHDAGGITLATMKEARTVSASLIALAGEM